MFGFEQCCDANEYMSLGAVCAADWRHCWNFLRPIGAILLSAIFGDLFPFFNHFLLLIFSIYLIGSEAGINLKISSITLYSHQLRVKALGAFFLLEFMFFGLASVYLTDVTAGIFAAFAILAFIRKNTLILAIAGAISVLIRSAYLYPMLVIVIFYIAESFYQKRKEGALATIFFILVALQFLLTYLKTGYLSFIDQNATAFWQNFHLSSNSSGYDTILHPSRGFHIVASGAKGLMEAYKDKDWISVCKLMLSRFDFYFSSFVPYNKVYLFAPNERIFSIFIGSLSLLMLFFSILYLRLRAWRISLPICLILAQSLIIIPEQRFIFVIQLFLVIYTYIYVVENVYSFLIPNPLGISENNATKA